MNDVRPTALTRYMEEDEQAISSLSKAARRVKIETNHTWNLRILPVEMGPDKMPYVRLAQHWRNNKPLTCPRHTSKAWGGDPDYNCPVCDVSERLNESSNDDIRNLGYQARCVLRFRFWCVVFDKEDARGKIEEMSLDEILNPYEFDMYKTTWEDFKKFQKWATNRRRGNVEPSPWGVMDLETGVNMLATHGAKGVRLDRTDPGPIFELNDPEFDAKIKRIWSRLRKPVITVASERQLLEMAVKFEEDAEGGGRRRSTRSRDDDRGGRGRSRASGEDEDDDNRGSERLDRGERRSRYSGEDEDEPRSSRRAQRTDDDSGSEPPARSRRTEPEPEAEGAGAPPSRRGQAVSAQDMAEDQIPGAEVPPPTSPKRGGIEIPPPVRRASTPPPADEAPPAPPTRRAATPPPVGEDAENSEGPSGPPPRRSQQPAAGAPTGGVDENEDNVPEEAKDPAPPIKERVVDEAPPAVAATAPPPTRQLSDVKARLAKLTSRGQ